MEQVDLRRVQLGLYNDKLSFVLFICLSFHLLVFPLIKSWEDQKRLNIINYTCYIDFFYDHKQNIYLNRRDPEKSNIEDTVSNETSDIIGQEIKVQSNHTVINTNIRIKFCFKNSIWQEINK